VQDAKKTAEFWPVNNQNTLELSAGEILAIKIAEYIKSQIDNKIILPSTKMAARPGDFMILFRTRDEFTLEVVKQIKHLGLEVAGIDRILLSDNPAVLDLISVAKFTLNPEDDLTLACLLKSPLIGLKEEELQKLCLTRGEKSLWRHIQESSPDICETLKLFINMAVALNAKNFFHYLADVLGFREKLVAAVGLDCDDAIDELLNYSYNYATTTDCSLQSFIFWFENYRIDIKRGVENSDKIKIMTIHASKGLQAPCVIMCDTTSLPVSTGRFVWDKDGTALSAKNSNYVPEFFKNLKEEERKKSIQEYLRLLYVAMTRAEDHLIICGYLGQTKLPEHCWYNLVSFAMQGLPMVTEDEKFIYRREESDMVYADTAVCKEAEQIVYVKRPLHLYDQTKFAPEIAATHDRSPLIPNYSLKYGLVFHKILEDGIKLGNIQNLKSHPLITTLSEETQNKIKLSIDRISGNKEFTDLLDNAIKTELSVGTYEEGQVKIGRIDLLVIEEDKVTIIDYKSDSTPPVSLDLVPQNYINQLNSYRSIIQKLYKNHKVFCKILWLENGMLTMVNYSKVS
jgi:ATP-dependent helicase/nuclease subunit A